VGKLGEEMSEQNEWRLVTETCMDIEKEPRNRGQVARLTYQTNV